MASTTLVGIFDREQDAQAASRELAQVGVAAADISVAKNNAAGGYETRRGGDTEPASETGISGFFHRMFGSDVEDEERGLYSEAVRRGSTVVTADVDDQLVDRAADVFNRHDVVDLDRRAAQYKASGYQRFDETARPYSPDQSRTELQSFGAQGEVALPVIDEELHVGKRSVQRGGVRIVTRVTERPVEETVTLRDEQVRVSRRAADRDVTTADMAGIKDGVIEVTETDEEAVVSKQARVVEEVVVDKDVVDRDEKVRGSLRRTDVDVQDVAADKTSKR